MDPGDEFIYKLSTIDEDIILKIADSFFPNFERLSSLCRTSPSFNNLLCRDPWFLERWGRRDGFLQDDDKLDVETYGSPMKAYSNQWKNKGNTIFEGAEKYLVLPEPEEPVIGWYNPRLSGIVNILTRAGFTGDVEIINFYTRKYNGTPMLTDDSIAKSIIIGMVKGGHFRKALDEMDKNEEDKIIEVFEGVYIDFFLEIAIMLIVNLSKIEDLRYIMDTDRMVVSDLEYIFRGWFGTLGYYDEISTVQREIVNILYDKYKSEMGREDGLIHIVGGIFKYAYQSRNLDLLGRMIEDNIVPIDDLLEFLEFIIQGVVADPVLDIYDLTAEDTVAEFIMEPPDRFVNDDIEAVRMVLSSPKINESILNEFVSNIDLNYNNLQIVRDGHLTTFLLTPVMEILNDPRVSNDSLQTLWDKLNDNDEIIWPIIGEIEKQEFYLLLKERME